MLQLRRQYIATYRALHCKRPYYKPGGVERPYYKAITIQLPERLDSEFASAPLQWFALSVPRRLCVEVLLWSWEAARHWRSAPVVSRAFGAATQHAAMQHNYSVLCHTIKHVRCLALVLHWGLGQVGWVGVAPGTMCSGPKFRRVWARLLVLGLPGV